MTGARRPVPAWVRRQREAGQALALDREHAQLDAFGVSDEREVWAALHDGGVWCLDCAPGDISRSSFVLWSGSRACAHCGERLAAATTRKETFDGAMGESTARRPPPRRVVGLGR